MTDLPFLPNPDIVNEEEIMLRAETILAESDGNAKQRSAAIDEVVSMLIELGDEGTIQIYVDDLSKRYGITKKIFNAKIKSAIKAQPKTNGGLPTEIDIPDDVDKVQALKDGWWKARNAYWFLTKDGVYKASNFTMEPILHIYSKRDNKRIIEIRNEHGERKTLDLPSKNLVSPDLFQQSVFNEGNFIFFGTKMHHYRILSTVARAFPVANELRTLGWQREGFFAFSNGIYNGAWHPVDDFGVTEHNKTKFFSPAFSKIYADVREDDDEYENDRFFVYMKSPVKWSEWAKLMIEVYGDKAMIAIAFMVASLFRDLIYDKYKMFPHLFLFGEKQSGKSQLGWSLSNVLFYRMPPFNLNSGTMVGFFRRLARVRNGITWFDEYTNDIDEKRFQPIKAAYDGAGHEKGKMTTDNRTDTTKINSACVISGQYLPTRDDNALLTRSILLLFEKKNYDAAAIKNYDRLKEIENEGLSSIVTEVISLRQQLDDHYITSFQTEFDNIKSHMTANKLAFDERIVRNYVSILAPMHVIANHNLLPMPFEYETLKQIAIDRITDQSLQIAGSEAVSTFWMTIQFLFEANPPLIKEGEDFKITTVSGKLKIRNKSEANEVRDFSGEPAQLVFFRFVKIHPLYMETHRRQYGKNGVDYISMLHYIKNHPAYIGYTDSTRFDNQITNAYIFNYEKLKINLRNEAQSTNDPDPTEQPDGYKPDDDMPF